MPPPPSTEVVEAPLRSLSTLSADLVFEGQITGAGDLQIDGQVKGDVRVAHLIVGETGQVEGSITADAIEVRGRVLGGVKGKQVKLVSTAHLEGDITAEQLSIDVGAYFQGRVTQAQRPAAVAAPTPASQSGPVVTPVLTTPAAQNTPEPVPAE
ncbi:polymer-forming cytoskeletal protein [Brevundimonas nasdae]|uniref:Polymer-forming cytoskeletal protein n=2 Tax=Brevundimonas nasdae TaxID=172043 RepID=A0ABX8TR39_9CAUL|nr:polymer-forming cytoskeletal protein [Brevundimonas nasdae]QYC15730.1 polymer-forming cytoskeletal protein [Brevundimonas nasdae]